MKNCKSLVAKSFGLGSNFNFVKGFIANVLVIIILAALLHFSPKFVVICYQKVLLLFFENISKSFDLVKICTT